MNAIKKLDDRIKAILPYENKWYELVPEVSHDCVGCAFENCECYTMPTFCCLCDLGGIWKEIKEVTKISLNVPPRNCDAFTKSQVLEMLDKRSFSKEDTIEWLYATKGVEV